MYRIVYDPNHTRPFTIFCDGDFHGAFHTRELAELALTALRSTY